MCGDALDGGATHSSYKKESSQGLSRQAPKPSQAKPNQAKHLNDYYYRLGPAATGLSMAKQVL